MCWLKAKYTDIFSSSCCVFYFIFCFFAHMDFLSSLLVGAALCSIMISVVLRLRGFQVWSGCISELEDSCSKMMPRVKTQKLSDWISDCERGIGDLDDLALLIEGYAWFDLSITRPGAKTHSWPWIRHLSDLSMELWMFYEIPRSWLIWEKHTIIEQFVQTQTKTNSRKEHWHWMILQNRVTFNNNNFSHQFLKQSHFLNAQRTARVKAPSNVGPPLILSMMITPVASVWFTDDQTLHIHTFRKIFLGLREPETQIAQLKTSTIGFKTCISPRRLTPRWWFSLRGYVKRAWERGHSVLFPHQQMWSGVMNDLRRQTHVFSSLALMYLTFWDILYKRLKHASKLSVTQFSNSNSKANNCSVSNMCRKKKWSQ